MLQTNFELGAPNDIQMALNTTRSKTSHLYISVVLESQILVPVTPRQAIVELQVILSPPNLELLQYYKVSKYPMFLLLISESPKFHSMSTFFRVTGHIETSAPNQPKMIFSTTNSNVSRICVISANIFNQYPSTTNYFRVAGHFEASAQKDTKQH